MGEQSTVPGPLNILETCLYVDDLARAETFYRDILGFPLVGRKPGRHLFFRAGRGMLLLFLPTASGETTSEVPEHGAEGPGHIAFETPWEMLDRWAAHLHQNGVPVERVVQWSDTVRSIYFRDPAGNSLELTSGELWGEGASKWRDFSGPATWTE